MKYTLVFVFILISSVAFSQSVSSSTAAASGDPICVVDGKVLPAMAVSWSDSTKMVRAVDSVNPNSIDKIEVLNGQAATSKYGDAGKNGVVVITLKKKKI